jgi:glycerophosphoryl diester phosphodiesterase
MEAFAHAIDLGYRYLETDVHATADGVVVACHDIQLERTWGLKGKVSDYSYATLRELTGRSGSPVPTVEEILTVWPSAKLNIDAKSAGVVRPLSNLLSEGDFLKRVCIASFSDRRLRDLRALLGDGACFAVGAREIMRLKFGSYMGHLLPAPFISKAAAIQVPYKLGRIRVLDKRFVDEAHRQGGLVHVWTINSVSEMSELLDMGVDGIMTDNLSDLKRLLIARGLWQEQ